MALERNVWGVSWGRQTAQLSPARTDEARPAGVRARSTFSGRTGRRTPLTAPASRTPPPTPTPSRAEARSAFRASRVWSAPFSG